MTNLALAAALAGAMGLSVPAVATSAGRDGAPAATAQFGAYRDSQAIRLRVSERQLQQVILRIRNDGEALRRAVDASTPRGRAYGNRARQQGDTLQFLIDDLIEATDHFDDHQSRNEETRLDLEDVMRRGVALDRELVSGQYSQAQRNAWTRVRRDLDDFAAAYGTSWSWNNPQYGAAAPDTSTYRRFSGTYEIDPATSDDPQVIANQALSRVSAANRARISRQLANRLDPPDVLAIERVDDRVTIASSRGSRLSFDPNGQARTEPGLNGGTMTTRATLYGDRLEVSTSGTGTDFTVVFEPINDGQTMRVTRRLYDDALAQPVTVRSMYRRSSTVADWDLSGRERYAQPRYSSDFAALEGRVLIARLDNALNFRTARDGQRVTFTVDDTANSPFDGAVIEGFVLGTPTSSGGRTGLALDFDQIRLRNGRTSAFGGTIDRVLRPDGREVAFNADTAVESNDRTEEAIRRGAIGAAVGAIIGAVAGGGKGAAIGAAIGAGGGAGTVFVGQDEPLDLPRGTEFTIRASAPYEQ
jgi:hypothetical protein